MPIAGPEFARARAAPATPPGFYGRGEARRSLNVATGVKQISLIDDIPTGVESLPYDIERGFDVKPWLLLIALLLALFDLLVSYVLRGLGPRLKPGSAVGASAAIPRR